ncbi:hypothetical protein AB0N09_28235 [Streptomyces erythrochromogenes]|uniref:hypothetical protein n=1 Tax=Streptomyces erythrochromogenes TaxID=285574 RepID=UPI00342DB4A3
MSNVMPPADELPVIDEVLAAALTAQGAPGVRALGLLRDARRILTGTVLERPAEVAESCLRGAADALLSLPGVPVAVGLKSAAIALLDAVDALPDPPAAPPADEPATDTPEGPAGETDTVCRAPAAELPEATAVPQQSAGLSADPSASGARTDGASAEEWSRVREAAEVLRGQLVRPGGYHRARAAGIAERLMGVVLGSAQERALDVWGDVYAKASGTLHGSGADRARAVALYGQVLAAARELLVPLPGRAARVLELAALQKPGEKEAEELAGWADPRAEAYFFRSGPAPAWLKVLDEHAPHLLLADETSSMWPAAPFLEHLAAHAPDTSRPWLARHAVELAAAGPGALHALLRLAGAGALTPAAIRPLLPYVTARARPGVPVEQAAFSRRLTADWARTLPMPARDGYWLLVVEELLKDTVDVDHAGYLAMETVWARRRAGLESGPDGAARQEALPDAELHEAVRQEWAVRLPDHDVAGLLQELVATVHPTAGGPFRWARPARGALAGLLRRDLDATAEAVRRIVFAIDLDEVRLDWPVLAPTGQLVARAALDLAAADAAAGVPLGERLRAWPRIDASDPQVHDRLLAAHLAAHPPADGAHTEGVGPWWDRAADVTVRLLAGRPPAEGARLAALVLHHCPPERAAGLEQRAREALGPAPSTQEVEQVLPAGADQADGRVEPLASWLRVWDWSPVLPALLLTGFAPLLAGLRRLQPAGPPDPRTVARPVPLKHTVALNKEDLLELTAAAGPLAAATALAHAPDAGADGYAIVLNRLVGADPAAWTADVPAVLATLAVRPELGAFYLAAAATAASAPGAFPAGPAAAALAALTLRRALPTPEHHPSALVFADQALFDLLTVVWRTGADLGTQLPAVLDHLHTLAAPLTRPAGPPPPGSRHTPDPDPDPAPDCAGPGADGDVPGGLPDSHPAVRALACLLEYAAHRAPTDSELPADILDLIAGALAARSDDEAVTAAIGVRLPALHYRAPTFTAAHPELYALDPHRPSPAASWLRSGHPDPQLLAALDRGQLLAALREGRPRGVTHHVADALLAGHPLLGDPTPAWRELAAGPGGAEGATHLLMSLALLTLRRPRTDSGTREAAERAAVDAAIVWWTAALDAGLPPGALAGAGYFAGIGLTDELWLPLARRSAAHTPAQAEAGDIAERAAGHPRDPDALLLAVHLLTRPAPDPWYDAEVRRHARTLLQAAFALPEPERPAQAEQLRLALVEAGEVDLAGTVTPG